MFCKKNTPVKTMLLISALASFGAFANSPSLDASANDKVEQLPQIQGVNPSPVPVERALPSQSNEPSAEVEEIPN